jgi:hypothetical protein
MLASNNATTSHIMIAETVLICMCQNLYVATFADVPLDESFHF